jgi:hypothetical protein
VHAGIVVVHLELWVLLEEHIDGPKRVVVLPFLLASGDIPNMGLGPIHGHQIASRCNKFTVEIQFL